MPLPCAALMPAHSAPAPNMRFCLAGCRTAPLAHMPNRCAHPKTMHYEGMLQAAALPRCTAAHTRGSSSSSAAHTQPAGRTCCVELGRLGGGLSGRRRLLGVGGELAAVLLLNGPQAAAGRQAWRRPGMSGPAAQSLARLPLPLPDTGRAIRLQAALLPAARPPTTLWAFSQPLARSAAALQPPSCAMPGTWPGQRLSACCERPTADR